MTATLMIQGCGSDVGKSTLVAGLCRLFTNQGLTVRPFKPQNMSNNAAVVAEGGEIGRAQAVQAQACRTPPTVDMNPILLKPQSDVGAQLIVQGRMEGRWTARGFHERKPELLQVAVESFRRLERESDLVLVEGAGSPAETNLRRGDIANMGFARATSTPVALVGDIDRGHVIAALAGAHLVLDPQDRALIQGFIINKFRGDPSLFEDGRREIHRRTGWTDLGMAPWMASARRLPSEDGVVLDRPNPAPGPAKVKIVAPLFKAIANFDDCDPLMAEPGVAFHFVLPGRPLPGDADLVILPGSKSTLSDLQMMRTEGWDIDLLAHVRRGGRVLGLCGGYQMLGRRIYDLDGIDGLPGEALGLGLLDLETRMTQTKTLTAAAGRLTGSGAAFDGYEMHVGDTVGPGLSRPFLIHHDGRSDGAVSADGRIAGTYVHGLFQRRTARQALLAALGGHAALGDHSDAVDAALEEVAEVLSSSLDIASLRKIAGL